MSTYFAESANFLVKMSDVKEKKSGVGIEHGVGGISL